MFVLIFEQHLVILAYLTIKVNRIILLFVKMYKFIQRKIFQQCREKIKIDALIIKVLYN